MNILTKGQRLDSAKAVFFNIFHGFKIYSSVVDMGPCINVVFKITKNIFNYEVVKPV